MLGFAGGWATDLGPSFTASPQGNALSLPFLLSADNLTFELDGGPHKVGGATRLNSSQVTDGTSPSLFHGLSDCWFQGTAGSETQKAVAYADTRIVKMDAMDGTWDELTTGLENNREPCFSMFNDAVILSTTSTTDVPQSWNGAAATTSNLSAGAPNFSFHTPHKNRMWAAGVASNPSRLYYSASLDATDWTTAGNAGSIDIDPSDGDRIVGLISHKNELIIFKGPNRLSIHRITGSSPSDFARVPFVTGVGGVNHNSIFRINDDVVFASPRGIHSLAATAAYGDYIEAFLARPILTYYQDSLNASMLDKSWGVNYQAKGLAVWSFAKSSGSVKNVYLVYDYRFQPGRWVSWGKSNAYQNGHCLSILQTTARKHRLFAGTSEGFVYQLDVAARSINAATAYTYEWQTPFLNFGTSSVMKAASDMYISLLPKGSADLTFGYTRDTQTEQTEAVSQNSGNVLA